MAFVSLISNELEVTRGLSEELTIPVARNVVAKGLKLFATKSESLVFHPSAPLTVLR